MEMGGQEIEREGEKERGSEWKREEGDEGNKGKDKQDRIKKKKG